MLWCIAVGQLHNFVGRTDKHVAAVVEGFLCHFAAGQQCQLSLHLLPHLFQLGLAGGDEQHLRVSAMLCLRQQVGSHKLGVGTIVGQYADFRRTGRHVDGYVLQRNVLLGSHHVLVARTEYLVYLWYALRAVGHGSDGLYASGLENPIHSGDACRHKDGGVHLALLVRRGAEHNLLASGNLGWCGQHEHGREEWGSAARYVQSYALNGYAFLPAGHSLLRLHLLSHEALRNVEHLNVVVSQYDGVAQFVAYQLLRLVHFRLADGKCLQLGLVELSFIFAHGLVATLADVAEHRRHRLVQPCKVQSRTLYYLGPLAFFRIPVYLHSGSKLFTFHYSLLPSNYHFLYRRDQDALCTHLLQLSNNFPEALLVQHRVY